MDRGLVPMHWPHGRHLKNTIETADSVGIRQDMLMPGDADGIAEVWPKLPLKPPTNVSQDPCGCHFVNGDTGLSPAGPSHVPAR